VFLPYNEFLELWEAARGKAEVKPPPDLPVDALIAEFAATATVSRDVMTVSARVRVDVLKEGWNRVSLRLADAALTKAILDDSAPAHVVYDKDQGYVLLLDKPGKEPRQFRVDIEFAKAFTKAPGQNTVSFENPPATVSCWDVRIPEPGIKLSVQPAMATTDVPAPATGATQTQVLAFVGPAPTVRFEWTPKAEGARGLAALASAQAEQQVWVDEGILRSRVRLSYDISRAELSTFTVEVPAEYRVSNVFDPNVREWQVAAAGAVQTITVQTFEPAKVSQALVIEIEKPLADAEVAVPVVKAGSVGRQQGVVLVRWPTACVPRSCAATGCCRWTPASSRPSRPPAVGNTATGMRRCRSP
jgi:hypothetical protein